MKLIKEYTEYNELDVISEANEEGGRIFRISGPFLQSEVKNRNGRIYDKPLMEREVSVYNTEKIAHHRALGELDHPDQPSINLDRVSHIVESLQMNGNDGMGIAKILKSTPCGQIAHGLLADGVKLGVSTRGVGTITGNKVNGDFRLLAIDIVADPSAPNAFVEGILENKEFMINNNNIVEVAVQNLQSTMDNKGLRAARIGMFEFLEELRKNL